MAINLDIRHLRMLVALDQHGGVTAAARALGISQPALSYQINEAERRAGVPLFRRVRRRLVFTWQGQELLHSARSVVAELERAERDLSRYGDSPHALVRLVTRAYCPFGWWPGFVRHLRERHPDIEIEHHVETLTPPLAVLESGAADLVLSPGVPRSRAFHVIPAFDDPLVALVPKGSELADREYLEATDFADHAYVTYSTVLEGGLDHELLFRGGQAMPVTYLRTASMEAMAGMVTSWAAREISKRFPQLTARPLTAHGLNCQWGVVQAIGVSADHPSSVVARQLVSWLAKVTQSS